VTGDEIPAGAVRAAAEVYEDASAPGVLRTREEIARFFVGLEMVEPGLVEVSAWRPPPLDHRRRPALFYAGVGRKPESGRDPLHIGAPGACCVTEIGRR